MKEPREHLGEHGLDESQIVFRKRSAHSLETLESMPQAVLILDAEGMALRANSTFYRMAQVVGMPASPNGQAQELALFGRSTTSPLLDEYSFEEMCARILRGEVAEISVDMYFAAGADAHWIRVNASPCRLEESTGVLVEYNDITEVKLAEQKRTLASAAVRAVVEAEGLSCPFRAVVHTILDTGHWNLAAFWRFHHGELSCSETLGTPVLPNHVRLVARPGAIAMRAWLAGVPEWSGQLSTEETFLNSVTGRPRMFSSAYAVPIACDADEASVVVLFSESGQEPDRTMLELVTSLLQSSSIGDQDTQPRRKSTPPRAPAALAASCDAPVLLLGETGVGKTRFAHEIHASSARAAAPFLDLNCACLSPQLVESELFGHERGAFTGADAKTRGLLELASGGSVFLDEIGELDATVQAKLLKVLETRKFRRIGGSMEIRVDVRFIAATNRDLRAEIKAGRFREDLYYRINVLEITIPSLRDRLHEIRSLSESILDEIAHESGRPRVGLRPEAVEVLKRYDWPGNLRELRNAMERAELITQGEISARTLLAALRQPQADDCILVEPQSIRSPRLADHERAHLENVLIESGGNLSRAAQSLGISRSTLYEKLRRFNIDIATARVPRTVR